MSEISNKTLVGLLVVAIVISLAGTFISLNKLGQLRSITGFQANQTTQSGTTQVQILGTAQITLYENTMNFGAGQVNGTYTTGHDFCRLGSNATQTSGGNAFTSGIGGISAECVGTGWLIPNSFVVENTGNTDFTTGLKMNTTSGNAGFQSTFTSSVTNGTWDYIVYEEGANACSAHNSSYVNVIGATPSYICTAFQAQGDDAVLVQMNVSLPEDAAAASMSETVQFIADV